MAKAKIAATDDPTQDLLNKQFGEGSVMTLGDAGHLQVSDGVSTGSIKVDDILGGFGLAFGRIVEILGPESCAKSSLSYSSLANAQKRGLTCVIVDAEHAIDPSWLENLGVDLNNVKICQPSCGEEGLVVVEKYLQSGRQCFILVDSVAALVPKKELEGECGDVHVALQARMMSQALRRLTGMTSTSNSVVVFINQIRSTIGGYGSNETTTGGRALKFYASQRIDLRRIETIKQGEEPIGIRVKAKIVKNKCGRPFRDATFALYTEGGIRLASDVFDLAVEKGIMEKSGSWVKLDGKSIAQGEPHAIEFLEENPEILQSIIDRIKAGKEPATAVVGGDGEISPE